MFSPVICPLRSAWATSSGRSWRRVGSPPVKTTCGMPICHSLSRMRFHSSVDKLGEAAGAGIVAVGAVVVAAVGQRQVHAVRRGRAGAEGRDRFDLQLVDRAGAIRAQQLVQIADKLRIVIVRLRLAHHIRLRQPVDGLLAGYVFQRQVRHESCGGIEVQHPAGVDQQQPVLVGVDAQMDAAALTCLLALVMVQPRGQVIRLGAV